MGFLFWWTTRILGDIPADRAAYYFVVSDIDGVAYQDNIDMNSSAQYRSQESEDSPEYRGLSRRTTS